ncbi:MAG: TPR REGION domain-containing protein [Bacteroidetes bacterium]|nr:TPR REGION domain-containing protein [Bacteroidota bacterium]
MEAIRDRRMKVLPRAFLLMLCLEVVLGRGCGSIPYPIVRMAMPEDFHSIRTVGVYVVPSDKPSLDFIFSNTLTLALMARGYHVVSFDTAARYFDRTSGISQEGQPEALLRFPEARTCEAVAYVETKWKLLEGFWREPGSSSGFFGSRTMVELNVDFIRVRDTMKLFHWEAIDTAKIYAHPRTAKVALAEHPRYLLQRIFSKGMAGFPICHQEDTVSATYRFPVAFYVDQSYRSHFKTDWQIRLQRRLLYVNDYFKKQFDTEFHIKAFREWNNPISSSFQLSLKDLQDVAGTSPAEFAIGVTLDGMLAMNWIHRNQVGIASLPGTHAVVSGIPSLPEVTVWNPIEESLVLLHEIGHMFGAFHILDRKSVMFNEGTTMSYQFDSVNARLIKASLRHFLQLTPRERLERHVKIFSALYVDTLRNNLTVVSSLGQSISRLVGLTILAPADNEEIPGLVGRWVNDLALQYAVLGYMKLSKRQWEPALAYFQKAIEQKPKFVEAYVYLIVLAAELKRPELEREYTDRLKELGLKKEAFE